MDSLRAFAIGEANRGKESMVFDWHEAARRIRAARATDVSAGLSGDWEYTGGGIFKDGKIIPKEDSCVYLASTWARPEIEIDGCLSDCFVMESETAGWDAGTYWPDTALAILNERGHPGLDIFDT